MPMAAKALVTGTELRVSYRLPHQFILVPVDVVLHEFPDLRWHGLRHVVVAAERNKFNVVVVFYKIIRHCLFLSRFWDMYHQI